MFPYNLSQKVYYESIDEKICSVNYYAVFIETGIRKANHVTLTRLTGKATILYCLEFTFQPAYACNISNKTIDGKSLVSAPSA